MANGSERGSILVGDLETRVDQLRAIDEELCRFVLRQGLWRLHLLQMGKRERRHSVRLLSTNAESFPAARDNRHLRALPHKRVGQPRAAVEQVLTVIEQQQQPLILEMLGERLDDWLALRFPHAEHRRHRLWHETRVRERREFHEPGAIRELFERVGGNLQAHPRLAAAASARERQQAGLGNQRLQLRQRLLTPNEARGLLRQVVRYGLQRTQRRKHVLQIRVQDLIDVFGGREVLEPDLA
jgi:hypothetical protein